MPALTEAMDAGHRSEQKGSFGMRLRIALILSALLNLLPTLLHTPSVSVHPLKAYVKWGFDAGNTGWNPQETILSPDDVTVNRFGKVWQRPVDGQIYAQPLYAAQVPMQKRGIHDIVIAATEHNSVYAFDAASIDPPDDLPLWQTKLGPSVPSELIHCNDLTPELGITSTPVLDADHETLFVVAKTLERGVQKWRLHALAITTGQERPGWGFEIAGSITNHSHKTVVFDPAVEFSRCALTLLANRLYIAFGSHCDHPNTSGYHGWIFSYNTDQPQARPLIFCTSPDAPGDSESAAGIWMSGAAPALDERGDVNVITGNGLFDADLAGRDVGDSFVKIETQNGNDLNFSGRADHFFTPGNQEALTRRDADLGSGGVMALSPQGSSSVPRLLIGGGKDNLLRLLDGDHLGGFKGRSNPRAISQILQEIQEPDGFWSSPAYYATPTDQWIYAMPVHSTLRQYRLARNRVGQWQMQEARQSLFIAGYPSSTPVVSSQKDRPDSGIVWLLNRGDNALHALLATDISKELYNSNQNVGRDGLGAAVIKFTVPTVANGRVYVGGDGKLLAYGLNPLDRYNPHHFVLVGPQTVSQDVPVTHQLWAVDANGAPIRITRTVRLCMRDEKGKEHDLPDLVFNRQSMAAWTHAYHTTGGRLIKAAPAEAVMVSSPLQVEPVASHGVMRYSIAAPRKAYPGQTIQVKISAQDSHGIAVPLSGHITLISSHCGRPSEMERTPLDLHGASQATVHAHALEEGPQLLTIADGRHSGTTILKVAPRTPLRGQVLLGEWNSRQRVHADILLLDPARHSHVIRRYRVVLEDDFHFEINAPDGVFDVALKPDHWLRQILKRVDTRTCGVLYFKGPQGRGLLNGDADGNDRIDAADLSLIRSRLGQPPDAKHPLMDLDGSRLLNPADMQIVEHHLGRHGDR